MRLAAVSLLFAPLVAGDLDIGIPPGTPLDASRELSRPVPTGHRGDVPTPGGRTIRKGPGSTVVEERTSKPGTRAVPEYFNAELYDYFHVISRDIMSHMVNPLPKTTGRVSQDDVASGGSAVVTWNYPPALPMELYWRAGCAYLRHGLYPEVCPWPEAAVYSLEIGEPAFYAGDCLKGLKYIKVPEKYWEYVTDKVKPLPKDPPPFPPSKDPKQALLNKLAAVELTSGYPYAIDPGYARRLLGMDAEAYPAIVACTKSSHTFLARNAVAVLAQHPSKEAAEDLLSILKDAKDDVVRVRALLALARRGEAAVAKELIALAENVDPPMRSLGMYALGILRHGDGGKAIAEVAKKCDIKDHDVLWSALPALGRTKAGKDVLVDLEAQLSKKIRGNDVVRAHARGGFTPEDNSAGFKVCRQMCAIALAMHGEKKFVDEVQKRVREGGLEAFYPVVHHLLVEQLAVSDEGAAILKRVLDDKKGELAVHFEAYKALAREGRLDGPYLKDKALDEKYHPALRGIAITILADVDAALLRDVSAKIVGDFAGDKGAIGDGTAFVVATAARAGGPGGGLNVKDLVKAVERAFEAKAFGRREGENVVDISKARIWMFPSLLETLAIELGRTGSADGLDILKTVLTKSRVPQGKAEAALAIGAIAGKDADAALVAALEDKDGWVRYCAYRALATRSGQDHFCDWIYGDNEHRRKPTESYKAWLGK